MIRNGRWMRHGLVVAILGICALQKAWAVNFSMDSWIITLEPDLKKSSHVLTLKYEGAEMPGGAPSSKNRSLQPVPVELSICPRTIDLDGKVIHDTSKAVPEFVIYPSQVILYPGDIQKVQIQWVSDKPLTKEVAYGLIATQLPVNLEPNAGDNRSVKAQLMVLTRYEGIVLVRPKNVKPQVVVDTVYSKKDTTGRTMMLVQLENKGTGLQLTKDMVFNIAPLDEKGRIQIAKRGSIRPQLNSDQARNAIFAGQTRRYSISWPSNLPVGPVQVTAEFP